MRGTLTAKLLQPFYPIVVYIVFIHFIRTIGSSTIAVRIFFSKYDDFGKCVDLVDLFLDLIF